MKPAISFRSRELALACIGAAVALSGCDGSAASSGSTSTGTGSEVQCVDDDLMVSGEFSGPGWDSATKSLVGTPKPSYVVATTLIFLKPDADDTFYKVSGKAIGAASAAPGFVGMMVGTSAKCHSARTLTVWESADAMLDFVMTPEHSACIDEADEVSTTATLTDWTAKPADLPPTFEEARTHLDGVSPLY